MEGRRRLMPGSRGVSGVVTAVVVALVATLTSCTMVGSPGSRGASPGGTYGGGSPTAGNPAPGSASIPGLPRIEPGSEREPGFDPRDIPDAVPVEGEPPSRYGNPQEYEVFGRTYRVLESSRGYDERGMASWYGDEFHGRPTSSQEPFDMYAMTAAHKSLPIPSYVEVENLDNGRKAVLRVNDRGPFHDGRIIDLSYAAALKLGVVAAGTARVRVRAVGSVQTRR